MNEVDAHLQWTAYSDSPASLSANWVIPGLVCPANWLERQLCTEGIGQKLGQTGARTTVGGGEPWQDHVLA